MSKKKDLKQVKTIVSVMYVKPTFLSTSICPNCDNVSFEELSGEVENKAILTTCQICDKPYKIFIPLQGDR